MLVLWEAENGNHRADFTSDGGVGWKRTGEKRCRGVKSGDAHLRRDGGVQEGLVAESEWNGTGGRGLRECGNIKRIWFRMERKMRIKSEKKGDWIWQSHGETQLRRGRRRFDKE
jgi:hypothetical protein